MTGSPARPKAVIAVPLAPSLLDQLAGCDLTVLRAGGSDAAALRGALAEADGLLVSSNVAVDRQVLAWAPRLRVISTMSVGLDHIDLDAARRRGILVTITPVLSDAVADLTMALLTMLARRIPEAMRAATGGHWHDVPLGGDLAGKVLLLVGFGRIGQAVAARALAARMRVRYVDARPDLPSVAGVDRVGELAEGLRQADFVSVHVDLNAGTRHLIGHDALAAMKPTAFLVNTARGSVVDQGASDRGAARRADRRCRPRRAARRAAASRRSARARAQRDHRPPYRLGHDGDQAGHGPVCRRQPGAWSSRWPGRRALILAAPRARAPVGTQGAPRVLAAVVGAASQAPTHGGPPRRRPGRCQRLPPHAPPHPCRPPRCLRTGQRSGDRARRAHANSTCEWHP